jgi:membrane protein
MAGTVAGKVTALRARSALLDVLWRTKDEARINGERRMAAEITYYTFFSLFPLLMVFVTLIDAMFDKKRSEDIINSVLGQFPVISNDILNNIGSPQGRGFAAAVGLVLALWAGSHAFESFEHAILVVWEGPAVAPMGLVKSRMRAFLLMGILGGAILVTTIVGSLLAAVDFMPGLVKPLSFTISLFLNALVILVVFRAMDPGHHSWSSHIPGAIIGGVGWTILQTLGAYFVRYFVKGASDTYGTFAVVIGLLTWINIQIRLILYAAELNTVLATRETGQEVVARASTSVGPLRTDREGA